MTVIEDMAAGMARIDNDAREAFAAEPSLMLDIIAAACRNGLQIDDDILAAISENHAAAANVATEKTVHALDDIIGSARPSYGLRWLDFTGLLDTLLPEISALKGVQTVEGHGHKDNFAHTLQVLDNVARVSSNRWLRWAALLHDIGKPSTKRYAAGVGWTFRNHDFIGEKLSRRIFSRLRLGDREQMQYVTRLVGKHMRPQQVGEEGVTDSAIRRMMTEMGDPDDLNDLMILAEADLTSKNPVKVRRVLDTFAKVRVRLDQIREADAFRLTPDLVNGNEIMTLLGMGPTPLLGEVKRAVNEYAEKEGLTHSQALDYLLNHAAGEFGLAATDNVAMLKQSLESEYQERKAKREEKERMEREKKESHDRKLGRIK